MLRHHENPLYNGYDGNIMSLSYLQELAEGKQQQQEKTPREHRRSSLLLSPHQSTGNSVFVSFHYIYESTKDVASFLLFQISRRRVGK